MAGVLELPFIKKIFAPLYIKVLYTSFLFLAGFTVISSFAHADGCLDDDYGILVKTGFNTTFYVADEYCNLAPFGYVEIWLIPEGFSDESAGIDMANPGSEPAHTVDPYSFVRFGDANGDGWIDATFHFETYSLRDVGIYYHTLTGTTSDGYSLYPLLISGFASEVTNWAPSASPEIVGSPEVGQTYDLRANSQDNDPGMGSETGSLSHQWQIVSPASHSGSIADTSNRNTEITFIDEDDIGDWQIRLRVDDNEGERITENLYFHVDELPPDVDILGDTDIDVLNDIHLHASTTVDLDGGPPLNFQWEILDAPETNTVNLAEIERNDQHLVIPTTGPECGVWQFRLTSSDNEHEQDDVDMVSVTVHNIFPEITVDGSSTIPVGEHIHFEVSPEEDLDGGMLDITWDLIQSPDASGYVPGPGFSTSAVLDIPTGPNEAGTWIFDLHVYDDEAFEQGEFHDRVQVLVDAAPVASATTTSDIVSLLNAVILDASGSTDPDTDNPHTNTEGPPVLSGGITYYDWWIIELPYDAYGDYFPGRVDEVLGAANGIANLSISPGMLSPGHWTFEVEVTDAEGNTDQTTISLEVIDPDSAPVSIVVPHASAHYTDVDGNLSESIAVDGCLSFDPDNLLDESYSPGLGIDSYEWSVIMGPSGCGVPHTLVEGPGPCAAVLFPAGSVLPPECQGVWMPALEVRDDEGNFGCGAGFVFIGNCPDHLCIDYPTTENYAYVEFTDETDIIIYYHLDTFVYSNPAFDEGMRLELKIFHDDDLINPAYSAHFDYDLLPTDRGGFLTFHWHGYTNHGERPLAGKYRVTITATSPADPTTVYEALEDEAIWIEVLDVEVLDTSDSLLSINGLKDGTDVLNVYFETSSYFTVGDIFDHAELIIKPEGSTTSIYEAPVADPSSGETSWDGLIAPGIYISPGSYTAQIEVFKEGHSLGVSPEYAFVAYALDCALDGVADEDEYDPGTVVKLGDTIDATLTLAPSDGSVNGDISLELLDGAGVIEITDSGATVSIDGSVSYTDADFVAPKVLTIEVVDTTNTPAELEIRFEPVDGAPEHIAADYVRINAIEVELAADTDNDGTITGADDGAEGAFPGLVRWVNADDDDGNNTLDINDAGPVPGEQDLAEVELHVSPDSLEGTLTLSTPLGAADIRLWEDETKTAQIVLPHTYTLGTDVVPGSVYVEGFDEGQARLKLEYHDLSSTLIAEDEIYMTIISVDLDVDTNRNVVIDAADELGEDMWSGAAGAIGYYNNDNDDLLSGDPDIDSVNDAIDGLSDEEDLALLVIHRAQISALPAGWRTVLSVPSHHDRLRVFDESGTAVIGPGLADEYEIPDITSADLNYHVEFIDYPSTVPVPPEFTLHLALHDALGEAYIDDTVIHVAPFMLKTNLDPANEMFVVSIPGNAASAAFVADLTTIAAAIGVPLTVIDGGLYGNDRWIQDEIEFGYSIKPSYELETVLDSPRNRGLDDFPENELLGANLGYFTIGSTSTTYDSFGNLECSPPVTVDGTYYPMGRIIYGENTGAGTGSDTGCSVSSYSQYRLAARGAC